MLVEHVYTALRAVYEGGLALTKPDWDSAYHISNSCLSSSDNQRVGWMSGHYMSSKCGTQNSLSGFGGGETRDASVWYPWGTCPYIPRYIRAYPVATAVYNGVPQDPPAGPGVGGVGILSSYIPKI